MIEVGQTKYSATVIRLDSLFAHDDGLPCRRIGTMADRLGDASIGTRYGWKGFERYRLFSSFIRKLGVAGRPPGELAKDDNCGIVRWRD